MLISFDDFKNIYESKNPNFISLTGNSATGYIVTLKAGYYAFSENLDFSADLYNITEYPHGLIRFSDSSKEIQFQYDNLSFRNWTHGEEVKNFTSLSLINNKGLTPALSTQIFYYAQYLDNTGLRPRIDYFGYTLANGWNESRIKVVRITSSKGIFVNTTTMSPTSDNTRFLNMLVFLMTGNNVDYFSETRAPRDPGIDITIEKAVTGGNVIENLNDALADSHYFDFTITINNKEFAQCKLKSRERKTFIDCPLVGSYSGLASIVYVISEAIDTTGRYLVDLSVLGEQGHEVRQDDDNVSLILKWSSTTSITQKTIRFTNIDKHYGASKGETAVSGIGEALGRVNEITPDNVAAFRNFVFGYNGKDNSAMMRAYYEYMGYNDETKRIGGVMNIEGHNFNIGQDITIPKYTLQMTDGMFFAYGYVGYCAAREFNFLPPAVEQYHIIYAEIDRSVIPNKASIKIKNNQGSEKILPNSFRRDVLSTVKTGKFQMPLWRIKLSNKGIEEVKDERVLRDYISHVKRCRNAKHISGVISAKATVVGEMKPLDTSDKTVATTEWVQAVIEQEIRR